MSGMRLHSEGAADSLPDIPVPRPGWSLRRIVGSGLRRIIDLYTFIGLILLLTGILMGDSWAITGLYHNMFPLAFLPSVLLLPLALLMRRWWAVIAFVPMFWLLGLDYFSNILNTVSIAEGETAFTLLTYNVYGIDRDFSDTVRVILEADTDIVLLQELSAPAAALILETLELQPELYPYRSIHTEDAMIQGYGILSRFVILEDEMFFVGARPTIQRIVLEIDGRPVTFFNVHTSPPSKGFNFNVKPRERMVRALLSLALQETNPVIMAGDFNMTERSDDYRRITRFFIDTHRNVGRGLGLTFPDMGALNPSLRFIPPTSRLDYVFHDTGVKSIRTRVWRESGGSDHRPVWALLSLLEG